MAWRRINCHANLSMPHIKHKRLLFGISAIMKPTENVLQLKPLERVQPNHLRFLLLITQVYAVKLTHGLGG